MARVAASEALRNISVALKQAGDRGNLNALRRGIRAEVAPMIGAARGAARTQLPKAGGLNNYEADQKIRTAVLSGVRVAGVRIVGKASIDTDKGTWRHPTPALLGYDRSYWKWVEQSYPQATGWWSKTMKSRAPAVQVAIVAELNAVAAKIQAAG